MSGYVYTPTSSEPVGDTNPLPVKSMNKNQSTGSSWTIPNGTTDSASYVNLDGKLLAALVIPSSYNGGNITFKCAQTAGGTYVDVYDSAGSLVTIAVGGSDRIVSITGTALQALASLQYVKIKCVTNVSADKTIGLILKG